MNDGLRDRYFLSLVLVLMRREQFQLVENPFPRSANRWTNLFGQPLPEYWLMKNKGRSYQLLRLQAIDSSTPSDLNRDIRCLADHTLLFRRRLRARSLEMTLLYLLPTGQPLPPFQLDGEGISVDDRASRVNVQLVRIDETDWPYASPYIRGLNLNQLNIDHQEAMVEINRLAQLHSKTELEAMIEAEAKEQEEAFNQVFHYGKPYLTFFFLGVNIMIFLIVEAVGSSTAPQTLIQFGAKWNPLIIEGEYWRLITPMFLHIGLWHLLINSMALFFLGGAVERIFGSRRFLYIYMLAGLFGTLTSFAFTPNLAAGASGAIFGCFGALLYFGLKRRDLFFRTMGMDILFAVLFNIIIGFMIPMIDNFGHIGGLVGGFLAAAMLQLPQERELKGKALSAFALALAMVMLLTVGLNQSLDSPLYHLVQAEVLLSEERVDEALEHIEHARALGYDRPEVYLQLGVIYNHQGEYERAEQNLVKAKEKGADQAELYFHLSYAQLMQGNLDEGRVNLQEAIARDPQLMEAYYNLALIYAEQEEYSYALEVLDRAYQRGLKDEKLEDLYEQILKEQENSSAVSRSPV